MMPAVKIATDRFRLVIGLGETGWSVVRYLAQNQLPFAVADTRRNPPYASSLQQQLPKVSCSLGYVDEKLMQYADEIILSPGISQNEDFVLKAKALGKPIISDIALFLRSVSEPVIAVSGSNGKSTVTSLLAQMAARQGLATATGGNLGTPVLDLIRKDVTVYILELSSFQLELTHQLAAKVACLINVTPDHEERYERFQDYYHAKQKIFEKCEAAVYNKSDKLTLPLFAPQKGGTAAVGLGPPDIGEWGILTKSGEEHLAAGVEFLMPAKDVGLAGKHNLINVLMALAVASKANWSISHCLEVVREFRGLPHRCERVGRIRGVDYVNDSKATNPAATRAALDGLAGDYKHIHILLGGKSKQADFTPIRQSLEHINATAYLMGEEAGRLSQSLGVKTHIEICADMTDAFLRSSQNANSGDLVLLSPSCASFDMYDNFAARGDHFRSMVCSLEKSSI